MTDYYPLLIRAVAGLEKNNGEARRSLYERARNALVEQLRSSDPPLNESEITRERLALEEAVRRVEAEAARQMRSPSPPRPAPPPPSRAEPPRSGRDGNAALVRAAADAGSPARLPDSSGATPGTSAQRRPPRASPPNDGVAGMRDVVADAAALGTATAQAGRSARDAYAAVPSDDPALDRLEPRMDGSSHEASGGREPIRPRERAADQPDRAPGTLPRRRVPGPVPRRDAAADRSPGNPGRRGLVAAILSMLIIGGLGYGAYWQRERISALFGTERGWTPQPAGDAAQNRPKANDRVGQDGQPASSTQPGTPSAPLPVVAQRVILYEEDPANPDGNRLAGSALWRTETVSPGPGLSPELAIRADVEIPDRRIAMTMSIRRNTDPALPASHTVEIMFNLPADFAFGGVSNVPGLFMKEAEQARGAPLSGHGVKVTTGFFLIGLSSAEADMQRNLQLLRERGWFDVPLVYNNNRRAILAIEKGTPGERAFTEAFNTWGR